MSILSEDEKKFIKRITELLMKYGDCAKEALPDWRSYVQKKYRKCLIVFGAISRPELSKNTSLISQCKSWIALGGTQVI